MDLQVLVVLVFEAEDTGVKAPCYPSLNIWVRQLLKTIELCLRIDKKPV